RDFHVTGVQTCALPNSEVARTEYRAIRQGEIVHPLHLHQIDRKAKILVRSNDEVGKYEAARAAIAEAVRQARAGRFPAAPAPSRSEEHTSELQSRENLV